uniref:Uncharacterized protein n=1 Tax=Salarias fasciatus TaxID=181472 RepID=A0A672FF09_SALFA
MFQFSRLTVPLKARVKGSKGHLTECVAVLRGLALSSRSELQQVLERRKRVQSDQTTERQSRTPLEDELLRRQQKQQLQHPEEGRAEAQLMEFVRVRQNLRKIHSVIQDKAANP